MPDQSDDKPTDPESAEMLELARRIRDKEAQGSRGKLPAAADPEPST